MAKFTEVFEDVTKQGTKIPTNRYLQDGLYPIIDQGQSEVAGYTNEEQGLFTNVPAIIFGDHTRIIKYVDTPCFLGADGVKLLKAKEPHANYKYLYYVLCNAEIPDTGYNRHFKWLKEANIPEHSAKEQGDIVAQLEMIDNLISLRKQQLSKLDELVKSRFIELFGDVKTNKFGWEKCHFGDVTTKITDGEHGTVPRVEKGEGYLYFMARNITKDGNIDLTETSYVPEETHRKIYKRCNPETGDILLVCVGATIGKCTIVPKDFEEFCMARSVALIKPDNQKVNSTFLISLLKSDAIQNDIFNCAHAAAQAGLYTNMIINLDAFLPPIELQNQFATFVEQTDKSKFEIQKSLETLETLKKALMQKYFG